MNQILLYLNKIISEEREYDILIARSSISSASSDLYDLFHNLVHFYRKKSIFQVQRSLFLTDRYQNLLMIF